MITRLVAPDTERIYDDEIGRFVEGSAIPCHRCGVCCERWQPLVSCEEVRRLAEYLEIGEATFLEGYTTCYPLDDAQRLLQQRNGACVFLRYEGEGRSLCSVHPVRPDICRSWTASLDRRECVDGLGRFGASDMLIPMQVVYGARDERDAFMETIRGEGR